MNDRKINGLNRFLIAQDKDYEIALREIKNGKKISHCMWYIFPQIKGLGYSEISKYYAINDLEEAREYLDNELLKSRLINIINELLKLEVNDAEEIFGDIDSLKLHSSITLFYLANPTILQFALVLQKFFDGKLDMNTQNIVKKMRI